MSIFIEKNFQIFFARWRALTLRRASPFCLTGFLVCGLLVATLGGCRKKILPLGQPGPVRVDVLVRTPADLNSGHAVVFRVYPLRNDVKFREATTETFWQNDEKALDKDLLGTKFEFTLYPNTTKVLNMKVAPETKFLGFAADFYNPDASRWHQVITLAAARSKNTIVDVGKDFLSVTNK